MVVLPISIDCSRKNSRSLPVAPVIADNCDIAAENCLVSFAIFRSVFPTLIVANAAPKSFIAFVVRPDCLPSPSISFVAALTCRLSTCISNLATSTILKPLIVSKHRLNCFLVYSRRIDISIRTGDIFIVVLLKLICKQNRQSPN